MEWGISAMGMGNFSYVLLKIGKNCMTEILQ
jgi:hypothetical protein